MCTMPWYEEESLVKFNSPSTITLVSSSNGGKTSFVLKLLKYADGMFTEGLSTIVYCYGSSWQPIFDEMLTINPSIHFKEGLPTDTEMQLLSQDKNHTCLILDDLMTEINTSSRSLEKLWSVHSHHYKMTLVYLAHNLYQKSPSARNIALNTQVFIIFKNHRDTQQIQYFGRQIYGNKSSFFNKAYQLATANRWGYLVVDLDARSIDKYRLRTNIFPNENVIIYVQD